MGEVRRLIGAHRHLQTVIGGIGRDTALQAAGVLSTVGLLVVVVAVTLGLVVPGASGPLSSPSGAADHENPATVTDESSLSAVEQQLASRLARQVESGAVNLTREDYERAREQVDNETLDQLVEEYGQVAQQTGQSEQYTNLVRARRAQTNHTEHVATYWELYDRYQRMTNESAANDSVDVPTGVVTPDPTEQTLRDIARELEFHATRANETAATAIETYRTLSTSGAIDYTRVIESLAESRDEVTSTQESVRREQFTVTDFVVYTLDDTGSPTDPIELLGKLETSNGTGLATQNATVTIGNETRTVTTDSGGRFRLSYRPTTMPANTSTLTVAYEPANESAYLGDSETVAVTVEPVEPTVTFSISPPSARFDDAVLVTGAVAVDDRPVGTVPYLVAIDGVVVARNETSDTGTFTETVSVPSDIEAGDATVSVRLLTAGQALAATAAESTLTVDRTRSALSFQATTAGTETVRVSGRLAADGSGVAGQSLTVRVNGTVVRTLRTDTDGRFDQSVIVPDSVVADGDSVALVNVTYSGAGTNIDPAQATAQTRVRAAGGGFDAVWLLALAAVVLLLGGYLFVRSRRETVTVEPDDPTTPLDPTPETDSTTHVEYATDLLAADDPAGAVRAGYAALRQQLGDETAGGRTHWEFYHACRDRLDADSESRLRTVTEYYERVAFAGEQADEAMAREVIEMARTLGDVETADS